MEEAPVLAMTNLLASKTKARTNPKMGVRKSPPHTQQTAIRRSPRQAQKKRAYIARQSLPGAFKEVDAETLDMTEDGSGWRATGGTATIMGTGTRVKVKGYRKSGVEVLDMTGA